jgi:hypothetical protein
MSTYIKKPIPIEAYRFRKNYDSLLEEPEWIIEAIKDHKVWFYKEDDKPVKMRIQTLEGIMTANLGDYIIQGVRGELYACKPDIFEETYDKVGE